MLCRPSFAALVIVAAVPFAGCEWAFPLDSPGSVVDASADVDLPIDRDVRGQEIAHHIGAGGVELVPADLSRVGVAALIPDPAATAGFRVLEGAGSADGRFAIPDVPVGPYYLRWQPDGAEVPTYFVTDARDLDFSLPLMRPRGRADIVAETAVTFDLTQVQAWSAGDRLVAYATGGWALAPVATSAPGFPTAGATTMALTVDWHGAQGWYGAFPPVLSEADGDRLALLRYGVRQTSTGESYEAVEESFLAPSSLISGTPRALSGVFADAAPNLQFAFSSSAAAFAARAEEAMPEGAPLGDVGWQVMAVPGADRGAAVGLPLASGSVSPTTPNDSDRGAVSYTDPFGNLWTHVLAGTYTAGVLYTLPGSTAQVPRLTQIYVLSPISQGSASLTPVVALPTLTMLAGAALVTDDQVVTLDAAQPIELSWGVTDGRADHYAISVFRITAGGDRRAVAYLRTGAQRVMIPGATFAANQRYLIEITAITGWPRASAGDWFTTSWPRAKASRDSVVFRIADTAGA